eukprot:m51a1_g1976 putative puf4p (728) ;mRNA; r:1111330-1114073
MSSELMRPRALAAEAPEASPAAPDVPERSTSAPPVTLTRDGLFAFRAEEYMMFSDIRCDANYYEFYNSQQNKERLPPPLETQPFLLGTELVDGRDGLSLPQQLARQQQAEQMPQRLSAPPSRAPVMQMPPMQCAPGAQGMPRPSAAYPRPSALPDWQQRWLRSDATSPLDSSSPMYSPLPRKVASLVLEDTESPFALDDARCCAAAAAPPPMQQMQQQQRMSLPPMQQMQALQQQMAQLQLGAPGQLTTHAPANRPPMIAPALAAAAAAAGVGSSRFSMPTTLPSEDDMYGRGRRPRSTAGSNSSQVCKFFLQGYCTRGDRCKYLHEAPGEDHHAQTSPVRGPSPQSQWYTRPGSRTSAPSGAASSIVLASGATGAAGADEGARQYPEVGQLAGQIFAMCRDQHGCRYLQKQIDEGDPEVIGMIFNEIVEHTAHLMADPFGNYLCQKLIEHCTEWQRLQIVQTIAKDLVRISVNMHGTRAVQKLVEHLKTPAEIEIVREALKGSVVPLIQDLNGNHVIQRCLHQLSAADNQFIYDAVSENGRIVDVATHRHGCCVLQRCIDYASPQQKLQLVAEIVKNALPLVQDPFGNYVVQYVLDLPIEGLAKGLSARLKGHFIELSMQKFSSNVVEKIIQSNETEARVSIIQEMIEYQDMASILQDPFANYVIQTALSYADPVQHKKLVEAINPHLSVLRNTPYGKRIQNKIMKDSQAAMAPDRRSTGGGRHFR